MIISIHHGRVHTEKEQRGCTTSRLGPTSPPSQTTGKGILIQVRLQPPDLELIDRWIAAQPDPKPTRPEAIRQLVAIALGTGSFVSGPQCRYARLKSW